MNNCNCGCEVVPVIPLPSESFRKSTFVATGFSEVVAPNGTLTFGTSQRITGNAITMGENNRSINLNRAGLYQVSFSASAKGTNDATAVSFQLNRDGVAITDGFATFTPATAEGNIENVAFTTVISVNNTTSKDGKPFIPLTITNTGDSSDISFSQICVIKIA